METNLDFIIAGLGICIFIVFIVAFFMHVTKPRCKKCGCGKIYYTKLNSNRELEYISLCPNCDEQIDNL